MAHLTLIATSHGIVPGMDVQSSNRISVPSYVSHLVGRTHVEKTWGAISGSAVFDETPVPYALIVCQYDRNNIVVARVRAGATGAFVIPGLYVGNASDSYTVTAYKDGENARVYSGVRPADPYI